MLLFTHFLAWFFGGFAAVRLYFLIFGDHTPLEELFLPREIMRTGAVFIICLAWIICT